MSNLMKVQLGGSWLKRFLMRGTEPITLDRMLDKHHRLHFTTVPIERVKKWPRLSEQIYPER